MTKTMTADARQASTRQQSNDYRKHSTKSRRRPSIESFEIDFVQNRRVADKRTTEMFGAFVVEFHSLWRVCMDKDRNPSRQNVSQSLRPSTCQVCSSCLFHRRYPRRHSRRRGQDVQSRLSVCLCVCLSAL